MSTSMVMEMDGLDNCDVCMDPYDENIRPRGLPCGHNLCEKCIKRFLTNGNLTCPQCKKLHCAKNVNDFPINYTMLALISLFRKTQREAKSASPSEERSLKEPASHQIDNSCSLVSLTSLGDMSNKIKAFIQDYQESSQKLIQDGKEMHSELKLYQDFLLKRKGKHEQLIVQIMNLLQRNKDAVIEIDKECEAVSAELREREPLENLVTLNLTNLSTKTDSKEALVEISELDKSYAALEEWLVKCRKCFPAADTICMTERTVSDTEAALSMVNYADEEVSEQTLDLSTTSNVMEKLHLIRDPKLKLSQLQVKSEWRKKLLENGRVFAVQEKEGVTRSARITERDNKLYLHCLQEQKLPLVAHTIEQNELIGCLKKDSIMAFMDISWGGRIQGRITILLSPDTPLAQHFRVLCTGDLGPSYLHSSLLEVGWKGNITSECLTGGDYEGKDGNGGAALMTGLRPGDSIYTRKYKTGIVWSYWNDNDGPKIAQFSITTGNGANFNTGNVFGQVEDGLDVLKRAIAENDDIKRVSITDCGVLLPL